jgi:tripartite-type tricarboxylate transporter receptor subunit TctC
MTIVRILAPLLLSVTSWSPAFGAQAPDAWPTRPVRIVIPFVAGGGVDAVARIATIRLGAALGQQVIIDNRPGARAVIGAEIVAKAAPDGYTLLIVSDALTIMPFVERKLPFDVRGSFAPVSLLATQPLVLAVHPSLPVRSVKEFIALAKAKSGGLAYGTGALGHYLVGEYLKKVAGFDMTHVPYKGGAPAAIDLAGGQLPAALTGQSPMIPFARSGRIRILAVTSKSRSAALPNVPTLAEAGVAGFDLFEWIFMLAPAKTPKEITSRLNAEFAKTLATSEVKEKLEAGGFEAAPSTPQQLDAMIREALGRWGKLIPELNIKPE